MENLERDIDSFFEAKVKEYLERQIARLRLGKRLFSPSNTIALLKSFEEDIDNLGLTELIDSEHASTIDRWKKEFTRNVLVPKYLIANPHLPIERVMEMIKKAIRKAALEMKTDYYVRSCQEMIRNSLRATPILERLKRAKEMLSSSCAIIQKLEKDIPQEILHQALAPTSADRLVQSVTGVPLEPSPKSENHGFRMVPRRQPHQPHPPFSDQLTNYLKTRLTERINSRFTADQTLLEKLSIISDLQKTLGNAILAQWLSALSHKGPAELLNEAKMMLPHLFCTLRAEILAESCSNEIAHIKQHAAYTDYAKQREQVFQRYLRCFAQEVHLREAFIDAFKTLERTQQERSPAPTEPPTPKGPSKTSGWRKV